MTVRDCDLIVVIDDLRTPVEETSFDVRLFRDPVTALEFLQTHHARGWRVLELWLDHDMGYDADGSEFTIKPVWDWLIEIAVDGHPLDVEWVFAHTSNPYARDMMVKTLGRYYNAHADELPTQRSST